PSRAHGRRLRRGLPDGQAVRRRRVGLAARRAAVPAGAALLPRPCGQSDRAQLGRRRHARPVEVSGAAQAGRLCAAASGIGGRDPLSRRAARRRMSAVGAQEATARGLRIGARGGRAGAVATWSLIGLATLLILLWVLFVAPTT